MPMRACRDLFGGMFAVATLTLGLVAVMHIQDTLDAKPYEDDGEQQEDDDKCL